MKPWSEILKDPKVQAMSNSGRQMLLDRYYTEVVSAHPKFDNLSDDEKLQIKDEMWETIKLPEGRASGYDENPGFIANVAESFKRGREASLADVAWDKAKFGFGGKNIKEMARVEQVKEQLKKERQLDPIDGNWFTNFVYGSSSLIGGMSKGVEEGAGGAAAGAAAAGLAGQAGPQVATPEEAVTVPVAAGIGFTAGSAHYWFRQGRGMMDYAMTKELGYDEDVSGLVANFAAIPYALIEMTQVGQLTPGIRSVAKAGMKKGTKKFLKTKAGRTLASAGVAGGRYLQTLGFETLEEVGQEAIQITAEELAAQLSDKGHKIDKEFLANAGMRLWETAKAAAHDMALLPAGGAMQDFMAVQQAMPYAMAAMEAEIMDVVEAQKAPVTGEIGDGGMMLTEQEIAGEQRAQEVKRDFPDMAEQQMSEEAEAAVEPASLPEEVIQQLPEDAAEQLENQAEMQAAQQQMNFLSEEEKASTQRVKRTYREYVDKMVSGLKATIAHATGMRVVDEKTEVGKRKGLKKQLEIEKRVADDAFKAGIQKERAKLEAFKQKKKVEDATRNELATMAQKWLPVEERGKLIPKIKNAKTTKQLLEGIERISQVLDQALQRKAINNLKKTIKKVKKKYGRKQGGFKVLPEIEAPLTGLLESIDLTRMTEATRSKLEGLKELLDDAKEQAEEKGMVGSPHFVHNFDEAKKAIDRLNKTSVRDLDVESIEQIQNAIIGLIAYHELERALIRKDQAVELDEALEDIVSDIKSSRKKLAPKSDEIDNTILRRASGYVTKLLKTGMSNLDALSIIVSGGKESKLYQYLGKDMADGVREQYEHEFMIMDYVKKRLAELGVTENHLKDMSLMFRTNFKSRRNIPKISVKLESGVTLKLTMANIIDIYKHTLNPHNYKVLTNKYGIYLGNAKETTPPLTAQDVDNIIAKLSPEAKKVADVLGEAMQIQQMFINDTSIKLEGYEIATVENYWHAKRKMPKKVRGKEVDVYAENIESRGVLKERTSPNNYPLHIGDAFNNFVQSVGIGAEYSGLAIPYRNARAILNNAELQNVMEQNGYGDHLESMINILNQAQQHLIQYQVLSGLLSKLTRGVTRAIFSWAARLSVQQRFSILLAHNEFDAKYVVAARGIVDKKIISEIEEHSPTFRHRFLGFIGREMGDVARVGSVRKFFTGKDTFFDKQTKWVKENDRAAICDIWRMAKAEIKDQGKYEEGTQEFWYAATERAERVVRRTQPTWEPLFRSAIGGTKEGVQRALTMFHSQREKLYQMLQIANAQFKNSDRKTSDYRKWLKTHSLVYSNIALVNAWKILYNTGKAGLLTALLGETWDDDDEELKDYLVEWMTSSFADMFGLVYFLGPVSRDGIKRAIDVAMDKKSNVPVGYTVPFTRPITTGVQATTSWQKFIADTMEYGETDPELLSDVAVDTIEFMSYLFGLPGLPVADIIEEAKERE